MHKTENVSIVTQNEMNIKTVDALGRGYGTGRAKNDAIARVWISFAKHDSKSHAAKKSVSKNVSAEMNVVSNTASVDVKVNENDMKSYFKREALIALALKPIHALTNLPLNTKFNIECTVTGSGLASQAKALSLGIARGLLVLNPEFRESLRNAGLLTRGPIGKEREKYGQRGARADLPYKRR